ncbi:MAG: DUF4329 domain-containing protein [Elusimicrobiota bacterium]|nr:MAG: DUF4329 domain-containing protein [Elusimicrobiota bacterium]
MKAPLLAALLLAVPAARASANPASYATADEAAIAFVRIVREYPEQRKEYCTWLIKQADGRVAFGTINEGDFNRCPSSWPKPKGLVGSVHTHPLGGRDKDPGAAGQVFSEGDFAHAESSEVGVPVYLGAPAGHVLRYDPGGTTCWGKSFIMRQFKIVRDAPGGSVRGALPVNPGEKTPLFDVSGKPLPRPGYCKDASR